MSNTYDDFECRLSGKVQLEILAVGSELHAALQELTTEHITHPYQISLSEHVVITSKARVYTCKHNSICKGDDESFYLLKQFIQCKEVFLALCEPLTREANDGRFVHVVMIGGQVYKKLASLSRPMVYHKSGLSTYILTTNGCR